MNWTEYQEAKQKVETLNRSIGQLSRRLIWNLSEIREKEAERNELQREICFHGPRLEEQNARFWA